MPIKTINAKTLKQWLDNKEAIVIDVREPNEYQTENIPGATLIPLATITKNKLPPSKGQKIVLHCRLGKRGGNACEKLLAEDPSLDIYNLEGGIVAWEQQGYPINREAHFFLPLDQQVQLTIGLGVLLGSLLGYLLNPLWFLLSGFLGIGLCFSGLSGNCYLTKLLTKMPWNKGKQNSKISIN